MYVNMWACSFGSCKESTMNVCCFPLLTTVKIIQKMVVVLKQLANLAALTKEGKDLKSEISYTFLSLGSLVFLRNSVSYDGTLY